LFISLVLAGHLGGSLTHGSDFLNPFAKPNPSDQVGATNVPHTLDTANAEIYRDVIHPIFTAKCVQCHGKTKQKGNLAMHDFEQLLQGGKSGKVVLSGDALKSELIHRVFMDKDDKKHMPPLGKDQLLKSEVDIIFWWIQHGMDNRQKVSAVLSSDTVKAFFASIPKIPQLNLGNVPQVSKDTIALVTTQGFVVKPIYKGSNFVDVSAVNAATAGDNQIKVLKIIATQIAWLDISNTKISDASMVDISTFVHLVRLNIRNNQLSDQSINQINQLAHLEVLNIVGTKITDAGLLQLAKLPALKKIYCSNTAITKEGIAAFVQTKPLVEIIDAEHNNQ
jgi:mono/diheme cytochrome c family protein